MSDLSIAEINDFKKDCVEVVVNAFLELSNQDLENGWKGWKPIPHFGWYLANRNGQIWSLKKNDVLKQRERATTEGSYLNVTVVDDEFGETTVAVHRLIALAFLPYEPKWRELEVNHDDGDKHNNTPPNLAWVTRSQNIRHAFKTGLKRNARRTKVLDVLNDKVTEYYGIAEFADLVGVPYVKILTHYTQRPNTLFLDRYIIQHIDTEMVVKNPKQWREIIVMDYRTNKLIICPNAAVAGLKSGVNFNTILLALREKSTKLLNGCSFIYQEDTLTGSKFSQYTKEEIDASVVKYQSKPQHVVNRNPLAVKDHVDGNIYYFTSVEEAAKFTGLIAGTLRYILSVGQLWPVKEFSYKRSDNPNEFPDLTEDELALALIQKKPDSFGCKLTNLQDNTTHICGSLASAASKIGEPPHRIIQFVAKLNEEDRKSFRYKDIYQIDEIPSRRSLYMNM